MLCFLKNCQITLLISITIAIKQIFPVNWIFIDGMSLRFGSSRCSVWTSYRPTSFANSRLVHFKYASVR